MEKRQYKLTLLNLVGTTVGLLSHSSSPGIGPWVAVVVYEKGYYY